DYAKAKLKQKKLDAIIANEVGEGAKGFESDQNCVTLITKDAFLSFDEGSKKRLGFQLLHAIASLNLRSGCVE
ncbi:MAG TPA: bifunctional 4'-phosphopantothenoylcysteine decarboxylase/phosphopantothenoylcysteine synthetase, partial [Thiomicrorhabdus sp.]|nr:bifunctional 4'-phosphopantothenoylcysteine decarboxylase/phosphopantothenoylcysteine synthetase [Thiomicrorhabdus sp.]